MGKQISAAEIATKEPRRSARRSWRRCSRQQSAIQEARWNRSTAVPASLAWVVAMARVVATAWPAVAQVSATTQR
ncbi:hypothetical protein [Acrocarpospora corrugata]|uniref:hypothetical protein n=1 Tax=Acrocarpospora corrugata TaxID=35763 RepID=UPI0012D2C68F|nr:hypothetical protein [Acrocarpospora corrugata]